MPHAATSDASDAVAPRRVRPGRSVDYRGDRMVRMAGKESFMIALGRCRCSPPLRWRCRPALPWTSATVRRTSPRAPPWAARCTSIRWPTRLKKGPGRPVLLPGRVFGGLLGRGALLRRGGARVPGARRDGGRRVRRRHRHAVQVLGAGVPEQVPGRLGREAERDEVVRRGAQDASRVREPHLLRDRAGRLRRLPLHEPQPDQARREDARCAARR